MYWVRETIKLVVANSGFEDVVLTGTEQIVGTALHIQGGSWRLSRILGETPHERITRISEKRMITC
jgi:hypothetical protein